MDYEVVYVSFGQINHNYSYSKFKLVVMHISLSEIFIPYLNLQLMIIHFKKTILMDEYNLIHFHIIVIINNYSNYFNY
jgi:hypothetical protein